MKKRALDVVEAAKLELTEGSLEIYSPTTFSYFDNLKYMILS